MPVKEVVKLLPESLATPTMAGCKSTVCTVRLPESPWPVPPNGRRWPLAPRSTVPKFPATEACSFLVSGIAGEFKPRLIHFEVPIPEGLQVQAGLEGLGVPGQARALEVQVGVDRAQPLDLLPLEILEFIELGRGQALEVQVQLKDCGVNPGVEVSRDIAVRLTDLPFYLDFPPCRSAAEAQRAGQVPGGGPAGPEGVDLVTFERAEVCRSRRKRTRLFR